MPRANHHTLECLILNHAYNLFVSWVYNSVFTAILIKWLKVPCRARRSPQLETIPAKSKELQGRDIVGLSLAYTSKTSIENVNFRLNTFSLPHWVAKTRTTDFSFHKVELLP